MALMLNDTKIQGHELNVSAVLTLAGQSMSGQSSYTDTAETGDKPKQLSVSTAINYEDEAYLKTIIKLAEAKDGNGARTTYNVINPTAAVMGIRQVKFEGDVSVREDQILNCWRVTFKLTEKRSVPELKESRQQAKAVADQAPTGTNAETQTSVATSAVPTEEELTRFEKVLSWMNNKIGDADPDTSL